MRYHPRWPRRHLWYFPTTQCVDINTITSVTASRYHCCAVRLMRNAYCPNGRSSTSFVTLSTQPRISTSRGNAARSATLLRFTSHRSLLSVVGSRSGVGSSASAPGTGASASAVVSTVLHRLWSSPTPTPPFLNAASYA